MKAKDIKNCKPCHKPLLHTQLPLCWEVTEDIAKPIGDPVKSYVCETCALEPNVLAVLGEEENNK